jgi:hypothetical protein
MFEFSPSSICFSKAKPGSFILAERRIILWHSHSYGRISFEEHVSFATFLTIRKSTYTNVIIILVQHLSELLEKNPITNCFSNHFLGYKINLGQH